MYLAFDDKQKNIIFNKYSIYIRMTDRHIEEIERHLKRTEEETCDKMPYGVELVAWLDFSIWEL